MPMLGVVAMLKRCRVMERTARGRANAKAKGVKFGRKATFAWSEKLGLGSASMRWDDWCGALRAPLATLAPSKALFLGSDGRLQWEGLLTGFAAVLVAALTIAKLSQQIRQTGELAVDQRQRRSRATRAMLPLALSEIADYATVCINRLYALKPCFQPDGSLDRSKADHGPAKWVTPRMPENVLSVLKECIEFSDDGPARAMTDLVRHFQVQNFRLSEDISRIRLNDGVHLLLWANIEQNIQDAAELYARASALFPFSRSNVHQTFDLGPPLIYNALFAAGCFRNLGEIDALADRWQGGFQHRAEMEKMGWRSLGLVSDNSCPEIESNHQANPESLLWRVLGEIGCGTLIFGVFQQAAEHIGWIAATITPGLLFPLLTGIAIGLYCLRRYFRVAYGMLEIEVAMSVIFGIAESAAQLTVHADAATRNEWLIKALGGIYIAVRGLDNIISAPRFNATLGSLKAAATRPGPPCGVP
jgi:hypothetical protein